MNRSLGTDLYQAFVAVAEYRSFTRAGECLHRQQSTVSAQIRRLEEALGRTLFRRTSRTVDMTAAGKALLPFARSIMNLHDRAADAVHGSFVDGLRLGLPERFVDTLLQPMVDTLEEVSGAAPTVLCDRSPLLYEQYLNEALDVVLVTRGREQPAGLTVTSEPLVWAGTPEVDGIDTDQPLPLLLGPEDCPHRALALQALSRADIAYEVLWMAQSEFVLERAARQTCGITVLPQSHLTPELIELGPTLGLPEIGSVAVDLHVNPMTTQSLGDALGARLREAITQALDPMPST